LVLEEIKAFLETGSQFGRSLLTLLFFTS